MTTIEAVTAELERQGVQVDHAVDEAIRASMRVADGRDTARHVARNVRAAMRPNSTDPAAIAFRAAQRIGPA
jgi:ribosomal protein S28E/S33